MFITTAYAQAAGAASQAGYTDMLTQALPYLAIGLVFYLLLIRPQQTMQKKHLARLKTLQVGEEVVTAGGIIAKVKKLVDDDEIVIETDDGVKLRLVRNSISVVRGEIEPVIVKAKKADKA